MTVSGRESTASGECPIQLPLVLVVPSVNSPKVPPAGNPGRPPVMDRLAGMDARMSTSDVVRVVGVNRSTLFRWCKKGSFPPKHTSRGWLRSDIEKWLTGKAIQHL
jgi:predicted DNA-binding transcriptional regulator AlpA